jgi:ergothioneine biosynthesis protein EgtB
MLAAEKTLAHELVERMSHARWQSDALFGLVRAASLYERPIPERHRIVFYIGHLEAFDWNLLNDAVLGLPSAHPELDRLFAFGIDPVGGGLPTDLPSDWPALNTVHDYVNDVRGALDKNLARNLDRNPEKTNSEPRQTRAGFPLRTLLNVAVEHRLMHAETLAYMLHQLPLDMKVQPEASRTMLAAIANRPIAHGAVAIPAGRSTLGLERNSGSFGWDNEFAAHTVDVPAFEIDRYKVTNRQYLEFMAAGGYETRAWWKDDDWNWKTARGISHPLFWKKDGVNWFWRAMFADVALPLDWPVYVSHAEASAYARWAGKSLPTEAEWHRAAYGTPEGPARFYPWGNEYPDSELSTTFGNFDFQRWDPAAVNAAPEGQSAFGVHDIVGNGWEWTSTVFAPFPGFEPFPFYRGYSADFFDGKHFVMMGGSPRTAACMLRPTFRNWFQAHYQYVYAGFRCVSH